MLSILFTIWLFHLTATITPGANTFLVMQLAASGHRPNALSAALGVAVGSALWASLAVLGVSIIFTVFPVLRIALQIVGGLYLLYLASRLWASGSLHAAVGTKSVSNWGAFRLGLLTNFTNPKAALFFGSIFSACFPSLPSPLLLVSAVTLVFFNAWGWYSSVAYLFSWRAIRNVYLRHFAIAGKFTGVVLGAMGLRLLLASLREARP
jgi:threonine/homoserine/homoserine lactone efflux protein